MRSSEEWALKHYLTMDVLKEAVVRPNHNFRDVDFIAPLSNNHTGYNSVLKEQDWSVWIWGADAVYSDQAN